MEKAVFDFRISDLILKVLKPHRESAVGGLGAVGIPLMIFIISNNKISIQIFFISNN